MTRRNQQATPHDICDWLRRISTLNAGQRSQLSQMIGCIPADERGAYYAAVMTTPIARDYLHAHGWEWRESKIMQHAILHKLPDVAIDSHPDNQGFLREILMFFGADALLDSGIRSPYDPVGRRCKPELIRFALDNGANVATPDLWCLNGRREAIRAVMPYALRLVAECGTPNARLFNNLPLLAFAAELCDVSTIKTLIANGADPMVEIWGDSYVEARSILGHTLLREYGVTAEVIMAFGQAGTRFAIRHGMHIRFPQLLEQQTSPQDNLTFSSFNEASM